MTKTFDQTMIGLTIGLIVLIVLNFFVPEWLRTILLLSLARG